jgi:translation initiation factor 3 subunit H
VAPLLEKNLEYLNDCLDDLMVEQGKLSLHQNALRRQQQAIAQFKMQRRQENMARRAAGKHAGGLGSNSCLGWLQLAP